MLPLPPSWEHALSSCGVSVERRPLHLQMPTDPRLLPICERLRQQLDDPSTIADWAQRLNVNVKTIQRLFARQTGMTFGQWRQQARLLRALELLATGRKVIDVELTFGYDSPSLYDHVPQAVRPDTQPVFR